MIVPELVQFGKGVKLRSGHAEDDGMLGFRCLPQKTFHALQIFSVHLPYLLGLPEVTVWPGSCDPVPFMAFVLRSRELAQLQRDHKKLRICDDRGKKRTGVDYGT